MTAHPYPQKVVEAVANVLWPEMYVSGHAYELADKALSALWEASRVDTWEELESVPEFASVKAVRHITPNTARGLLSGGRLAHDLPAHVLYWGDAV